ncbi:MAG: ABC transporter permease, partial [Fusobacteriaceae bacterium]|nr:ABC transporter permease [Fusobacteriaceae bacterium]
MDNKRQNLFSRLLAVRGMGASLTAFAGLVVIYVAFGLMEPSVYSTTNIANLLRSMSKYLIVGIAQSYLLITGNIDLSIGSVVAMSAMISGTMLSRGYPLVLALLVTLAAAFAISLINGMLVGKFKLPPFIATVGTMFVARGIAYMSNGNRNTNALLTGMGKDKADVFQAAFYYGKTFGIYNTFWIALILFVLFFIVLSKTRTGRHIYAIGSNIDAAKMSGVNVVSTVTKAYMVSAFCSCVVGLILCAQAGMGNMEAGNMYEMYGVAAGVIGGVSPLGGQGLLLGTFMGAAVWQ